MTNNPKPKAVFILGGESFEQIYPASVRAEIESLVDVVMPLIPTKKEACQLPDLSGVEMVFSGWDMCPMDAAFLSALPDLKVVFYGAGTIRYCTMPEFWQSGVQITTASALNGEPVAEYTLATILLSLKHFWRYAKLAKLGHGWIDHPRDMPGAYGANVGIVSCGVIARKTIKLLSQHDLNVHVACPFLSESEAAQLGVQRRSLEELFASCDVVSLHTPNLPETRGMIKREHFAAMKPGATFINTSRGAVVCENDLISVAHERPDLTFILDVTDPEPPLPDSELMTLPNVVLTPHIAGSMGSEVGRMGEGMLDELKRYLAGKPLRWEVTAEMFERMA